MKMQFLPLFKPRVGSWRVGGRLGSGLVPMLTQHLFNTVPAEGLATAVRECGVLGLAFWFSEPMAQGDYHFFAQRTTPRLRPLPVTFIKPLESAVDLVDHPVLINRAEPGVGRVWVLE